MCCFKKKVRFRSQIYLFSHNLTLTFQWEWEEFKVHFCRIWYTFNCNTHCSHWIVMHTVLNCNTIIHFVLLCTLCSEIWIVMHTMIRIWLQSLHNFFDLHGSWSLVWFLISSDCSKIRSEILKDICSLLLVWRWFTWRKIWN